MEMFTKRKKLIFLSLVVITSIGLCVLRTFSQEPFQFIASTNKDLQAKLTFLDKISTCEKFKYQEDGVGSYEVFGKQNNACKIKWTLVDCNFPEGVYQEFSNVQKKRVVERYNNWLDKYYIEIENKDYRFLVNTGNLYCKNRY